MANAIKTARINRGLYAFSFGGRAFEVEEIGQASDGLCLPGWNVFEIVGPYGRREFWNDYATKRAAIIRTIEGLMEIAHKARVAAVHEADAREADELDRTARHAIERTCPDERGHEYAAWSRGHE